MKKIFYSAMLILLPSISFSQADSVPDYSNCLEKKSSAWGGKASQCMNFNDSYRVNLINTCRDTLDVKVAVQENTKRWRTFLRSNLKPNEIVSAYACTGTGKYMYWARKAGDAAVNFPADEMINLQNQK